ncbi:PD40 domain-containing protein [Holospora elegans]|uniref:PD40 domain-containing protein n=1 Tax=Holospora elegans TaxID=431043 RepID=UPI0003A1E390|nr:PD40 domain-containing protein [Holospora elegans]
MKQLIVLNSKILCLLSLLHVVGATKVQSALNLNVRKGISIVIPVCISGLGNASNVQKIIENDLKLSGFFRILPVIGENSSSESEEHVDTVSLQSWAHIPGSVFVQAQLKEEDDQQVCRLSFFNTLTKRCLGKQIVRQKGSNSRLFAHRVANAIYKQFTGEPGYFHSVIAYTYETHNSRDSKKNKQCIALVSVDGKECSFLTSPSKTGALLPHCARNRPIVTYLIDRGYGQHKQIGVMNFVEKTEFRLPYLRNFNSTRISADGNEVIFSCSGENGASLFGYNLNSGKIYPLTYPNNSYIDVSPSYSPDGKRMVFVSDRFGGIPKLFVSGLHSGNSPTCISKGSGRYFAPAWSPCGKWIAFVKRMNGRHYLCVSDCNGGQERAIAESLVIDRPAWGPNSRCLVYAAKNGDNAPYVLHIAHAFGNPAGGVTVRRLSTIINGVSHSANHPSWYPLSLEGHKE